MGQRIGLVGATDCAVETRMDEWPRLLHSPLRIFGFEVVTRVVLHLLEFPPQMGLTGTEIQRILNFLFSPHKEPFDG